MITISNMRNYKPSQPHHVRVDRANVLGNPFTMKSEDKRDTVCDLYIDWLGDKLIQPIENAQQREIARLKQLYKQYGTLTLFCWCAPKRCHTETIRDIILEATCSSGST